MLLRADRPKEYVVATGRTASVADFCQLAFASVGLDWRDHVRTDPSLTRLAEVPDLRGDAAKAKIELGWEPIVTLEELAAMVVAADPKRIGTDRVSPTDE